MGRVQTTASILVLLSSLTAQAGTYTVTQDIPTLREVSIFLYGTSRRYKEIAKSNHLNKPYRLEVGQVLELPLEPQLSAEEGYKALFHVWKKHWTRAHQTTLEKAMPSAEPAASFTPPADEPTPAPLTSPSPSPTPSPSEPSARTEQKAEPNAEDTATDHAQAEFERGKELLDSGNAKSALAHLRLSHKLNPALISTRITEIRALKLLKRNKAAEKATKKLLKEQPQLSALPMFQENESPQ